MTHVREVLGWHPMCLERGMRFVLAFLLVAHGIAHLVGFISSWNLATLAKLPYKRLSSRAVWTSGTRAFGSSACSGCSPHWAFWSRQSRWSPRRIGPVV
jgi:hypothetical protein